MIVLSPGSVLSTLPVFSSTAPRVDGAVASLDEPRRVSYNGNSRAVQGHGENHVINKEILC